MTKIKILLHYLGLYKKCPICSSKLYESYNFNRCSKCDFGNKFEGILKYPD